MKGLEYKQQNSWFFEKINKIYKPLAKIIKKKENTIHNTGNKKKMGYVSPKRQRKFNTSIREYIQFYAENLKH